MRLKCKECNGEFEAKYKRVYCSNECKKAGVLKTVRSKSYTQEQINRVIELKKQAVPNSLIVKQTGVNLTTVKAIIKENDLYLTPEQRIANRKATKHEKIDVDVINKEISIQNKEKTQNVLQKAIEEVKLGKDNATNIAKKYNISIGRLTKALKEKGLSNLLNLKKQKNEIVVNKAIEWLKSKKYRSFNEFYRDFNHPEIDKTSLRRGIIRKGYQNILPSRMTYFNNAVKEIIKELENPTTTETVYSLTTKYKVTHDKVCKKLRELGKGHLIKQIRSKEECIDICKRIIEEYDSNDNIKSYVTLCKKYNINRYITSVHLKELGRKDLLRPISSKEEDELSAFIKKVRPDIKVIRNDREILKGKELDIYIPSLNLAIEYCGVFWHSENQGKDRNYHYNKMKSCQERGVRLITIFSDEWRNRKKQVKNFLKSVLGVYEHKVYARKCQVKRILDNNIINNFLDETHIQGKAPNKVAFGLYYNDGLIGIVTGNNHHRNSTEKIFVLNRLSFKDGYLVVGGASRLNKRLLQYAMENGYTQMISWSDNRWSEGNVYRKLKYNEDGLLRPDYSYVIDEFNRISKQSCKKEKLAKIGGVGNTEREMALSLGLDRIWDCGKIRWKINLSPSF